MPPSLHSLTRPSERPTHKRLATYRPYSLPLQDKPQKGVCDVLCHSRSRALRDSWLRFRKMTYQKERRQVCHMTQVYISEREAKESEPLRESVLYGRTLRALRHNLFFVFLWFLLLSTFFFIVCFFALFFRT